MPKIIKEIKELKNKKNSLKVFLPRKEVVPILKKEQTLKPVQAKTIEKKTIPSHVSYPIPSNNQELSLVRKRVKH